MQWTDEGIVIGVKRHGEASGILELMTREHGRHFGLLPERDPHAGLYSVFEEILDRLEDPMLAAPLVVRFELQLLTELGFGLDLAQCASTGATIDLIYVSPKSGRAVSRAAGEPWADKMLRLPAFLRDLETQATGRDLADGFALTGFFLERHVLQPRGLTLSDERAHFIAALLRGPRSALAI